LLKFVLVERLFSLTREKLMKIPAFARLYGWYSQVIGEAATPGPLLFSSMISTRRTRALRE
jgi:hypothetical protein